MGCTGFALAPNRTADNRSLHARTFDGAFFAWNEMPGLFLIDERDSNPRIKHRYAALGTAGLIYPGGISGVNDAGIACSLHQMSTATYTLGSPGGEYEIAPFVQQRILREASELDEAVELVRSIPHFASWAILVSDARAGRSVRIEINGGAEADGRAPVQASDGSAVEIQTNHFREGEMPERFDHFRDAHFTPSLGKWIETRARLETISRKLEVLDGTLCTEDAIELLSDHDDAELGGARRPCGRTVCKAYGIMSSVTRASTDGSRASIWVTLGDGSTLPGPHSVAVGFAIDWDGLSLKPEGTHVSTTLGANALAGLEAYVAAFQTLERPRVGGRYLGANPTEEQLRLLRGRALAELDEAIDRGRQDPHMSSVVPYRYIRTRLLHEAGELEQARQAWMPL